MTTAAPTLESLTKDLGELQTKYKATADELTALKAAPNLSGLHRDSNNRITGYIEETEEEATIIAYDHQRSQTKANYKRLKNHHARELKSLGYQPRGDFKSLGEFLQFGMHNSSDKLESRLKSHTKAIQGLSTVVGEDGGFMVVPEFANGIIDRVYGNDLWARTDNYTVSGNNMTFTATAETSRANGSRAGGLRGYWTSEGGSTTATKPKTRQVSMRLLKLCVIVYLTEELMEDGPAMEQWVQSKVPEEFNFLIGDSLINGVGGNQGLGWMNAPSLLSIGAEAGQDPDTIVPENIVKMYSRFYAPNLPRATWYHNQDIGPQINLMSVGLGTSGQLVYMPPGGLSSAPYGMLQGRPMQPTEFNGTLGDQGDLMLCDMGQMLSIAKGGIAQAVSMHVEFLTGQTALRFTMRLNHTPWENSPITPYKGAANTQSNCVVLDAR